MNMPYVAIRCQFLSKPAPKNGSETATLNIQSKSEQLKKYWQRGSSIRIFRCGVRGRNEGHNANIPLQPRRIRGGRLVSDAGAFVLGHKQNIG
jgi:hypothetical protein